MTFEVIGTYATAIFLLIGSGFALVGVLGLLKFNDSMTRLHAPTKVGTVRIGALLLASMTY
ncbi:cation:proton antiporter, partial [Lentibacter algarum]|uniref:cation:proton antiporter n=1 Tax=Lentibacter algarum TaxID=576131 RepID=UPI0023A90CE1